MGLLDKFKKNAVPERVNGAAMLFCPLPDCRKVLEQIEELFHMEHVNEGNNITLRQGDMEIVFVAVSPEEEGENGRYAREQLQGAAGYVYQNETPLLEIKRSLFYHLRQCKCLVQIGYSFDSAGPGETKSKEKQIMAPILTVTETLQGVVTFGNSMAMLNGRGQVILDKAGKSQLGDYMPSELPLPEDCAPGEPGAAEPVHGAAAGEGHLCHLLASPAVGKGRGTGPQGGGGLRPGCGAADCGAVLRMPGGRTYVL